MSQSDSPPPSQSDKQTPADPQAFIEYSRALYEWTSQKWLQAVRESEEKRALLEREYRASRNLGSQSQPQTQQQAQQAPAMPQQPTQASSSEATGDDNRATQSPSNHNRTS